MGTWTRIEVAETAEHVRVLRLNRPERRNAIDHALAAELLEAVTELRGVRGLRALVVTGRGSAFCAGADLKERLAAGAGGARRQRDTLLRAIDVIDEFPCPVIASLNGPAIAGGLELALACDLRVAAESARLGLPELKTAGSFPGAGGPVRLAKLVGRGRASLVVLSARTFTAREAFELGFVEMVVPDAQLDDTVQALAADIAAGSPSGVRAVRRLIAESTDLDLAAAKARSRALRDPLDDGEDAREGVAAWVEGRSPRFRDG